jgi:hypothetical protein
MEEITQWHKLMIELYGLEGPGLEVDLTSFEREEIL